MANKPNVTKAFLQIKVHEDDQDVHRFVWQLKTEKFLRVPSGNSSSSFLLNATIGYHLSQYQLSIPVMELQDNLYVDDWISGTDHYEYAVLLYNQANVI